jgi:hypothetical protein
MIRICPHSAAQSRVPPCVRPAILSPLCAAAMLTLCGAVSVMALGASKVTVRLEGDIVPECALAGGTPSGPTVTAGLPIDIGEVSRPGRRDYAFVLDCNAPFSYRLEAQYGALTNLAAAPAPSGFTARVPYEVAVRIPTDGAPINDRCPGDSIRAGRVTCPFSTSGNSVALGSQAQITVTWKQTTEMPLSGAYVERLTIVVATSL